MPESKRKNLFETMLADHQVLMRQIAELREWCDQVSEMGEGPRFQEMGSRVEKLRTLLSTHFADEERDGYLAPALEVAPRFAKQVDELQQQHGTMLEELDLFIARLRETGEHAFTSWQHTRNDFEKFLTQLRRHEHAENAIVQSAFGDDIGDAD